MAAQDGTTFEGTFNSPSVGKFKDNTSNAIVEQFMRDLVTAIKESYLNRIDDVALYTNHMRGSYDLAIEDYPTSGGTGALGVPAVGDFWYGINEGDFDVHGFEGPVTLFRGAMLIYIGGTVTDPQSWIVKQ